MKWTPKQIAAFLTGPWMILPQAFVVAFLFGGILYVPPEIHRNLEKHIFFQGNTDWGGGCLFAGTIALYVAFGFTAAWHLVLKLHETQARTTFMRSLGRCLWILRFHISAFIIGGAANIGYDARVTPNDFRNIFLLALALYCLSILLVVILNFSRFSLSARLAIAPLFTALWLIVGSDGNTARAGQLVQSGQDPQPIIRGVRHGIMMRWHHFCDGLFGDVGAATNITTTLANWLYQAATLALFILILAAVGRALSRKALLSRKTYWTVVCLCITGIIGVMNAAKYVTFRADRNLILPVLAQVAANLSTQEIELIKNDPALQTREINLIKGNLLSAPVVAQIDRVFKPEYFKNGLNVRLLIPLEHDLWFFLWQNPSFRYADVRKLAGPYSHIIDYDEIRIMIEERRDFSTPFFAHWKKGMWGMLLDSPHVLAGNVLLDQSGHIAGVIIVNRR